MKPCCENHENREVIEKRDDLCVEQCKVCGAKHYVLSVDPIVIVAEASDLG